MVPPVLPEIGTGAWSMVVAGAVARRAATTTIITKKPTNNPSITEDVVDMVETAPGSVGT
jgi:hypothetical protein